MISHAIITFSEEVIKFKEKGERGQEIADTSKRSRQQIKSVSLSKRDKISRKKCLGAIRMGEGPIGNCNRDGSGHGPRNTPRKRAKKKKNKRSQRGI